MSTQWIVISSIQTGVIWTNYLAKLSKWDISIWLSPQNKFHFITFLPLFFLHIFFSFFCSFVLLASISLWTFFLFFWNRFIRPPKGILATASGETSSPSVATRQSTNWTVKSSENENRMKKKNIINYLLQPRGNIISILWISFCIGNKYIFHF